MVFQTALRSLSNRSKVVVGNYCSSPITAEQYREKTRPLRPRRSCFAPAETRLWLRQALVEAPGTAPGSEWFIVTVVYFHSRRTGTSNIGWNSSEGQCPSQGQAWGIFWMPPGFSPDITPNPHVFGSSPPGLAELFFAFAKISLAGFGGVLVFTRRAIVDRRRWMAAEEFNATFALCPFLPGPNTVNLSVVFGSRFRFVAGGIAALAGLLGPPMVLITILAALYARYGEVDALCRILAGVSCVAAGLLISSGFCWRHPTNAVRRQ
jgi:chromate transporter